MNIFNHFYYFKSAIPPRICDMIIEYGKSEKKREELAVIGGYGVDRNVNTDPLPKEQIDDLKKTRDSKVVWMSDQWIYKEIQPYIIMANKGAGWNFDWDFSEACQFTIYRKNQHYDWHCDSWDKPYEQGPQKGKIRKLSVTVSLIDPNEYKGGELEFDLRNKDPNKGPNVVTCKEILPKGSLVVFPSFVWHRVKPVTEGTRYSLVIWSLGAPFK